MGDMSLERGKHAHYIFFYIWLMERYKISALIETVACNEAVLVSVISKRPKVARVRIIFDLI